MNITQKLTKFFETSGHGRVRAVLLSRGPQWCEAMGYSWSALQAGLSGWPWRKDSVENQTNESEIKQAVKELKSYNDLELRDLGISRGDIEDAVRFGRAGFEKDLDQAA